MNRKYIEISWHLEKNARRQNFYERAEHQKKEYG